jgi:hypothetical protein
MKVWIVLALVSVGCGKTDIGPKASEGDPSSLGTSDAAPSVSLSMVDSGNADLFRFTADTSDGKVKIAFPIASVETGVTYVMRSGELNEGEKSLVLTYFELETSKKEVFKLKGSASFKFTAAAGGAYSANVNITGNTGEKEILVKSDNVKVTKLLSLSE